MAEALRTAPRRTEPRPLAKRTSPLAPAERPQLTVVPRRRRTAGVVTMAAALVFGLMACAAAFQTQLARRQLEVDRLDAEMREAADDYERLRRERADLRSPGRLSTEAAALGMVPGEQSEFMSIDPGVVAIVQMSVGTIGDDVGAADATEVEQRSRVKEVIGGTP
jgi:hypothetical protein